MSGTEFRDGSGDDGPSTLAAEYVVGTLNQAESEAARARAETDSGFAAELRDWEQRLFPLTALALPVEPPTVLWARIERSNADASPARAAAADTPRAANDNTVRFWRAATFAALAVAASLGAFIVVRPQAPPLSFAVLAPTGVAAPMLVAFGGTDGGFALRPSDAIPVAADRDLQLWSLPAGATRPVSLGILPAGGKQLPPGIALGTKLLVSLEPKGGSPTGQPTGPVVYGGTLQRL